MKEEQEEREAALLHHHPPYSPRGSSPPRAQSSYPRVVGSAPPATSALWVGAAGSAWVHPAPLPFPSPTSCPPTLPLSMGITPICSMVFRGACSGISWEGGGRTSGQPAGRRLAFPDPAAAPPPSPTHGQRLQGRLVRVDSEATGDKEVSSGPKARKLPPPQATRSPRVSVSDAPTSTPVRGLCHSPGVQPWGRRFSLLRVLFSKLLLLIC